MTTTPDLFSPLTLPNGATLPNRIAKAAMEENLCDAGQMPGARLVNLYQAWADGGTGLIITGNVMVAPNALTGPGGIVLQAGTFDTSGVEDRFKKWAKAAKSGGGHLVMQISHPGRQVFAAQGQQPVSASATKVTLPGFESLFETAHALSGDEVKEIIARFAETARLAETAGFDGVQIHGAHGYLVSQFLSPLTNLRDDEWGGPLKNRARFLLEIVRAVRAVVAPGFSVMVKLNSADFQRGGFELKDAKQVVKWLNKEDVDMVEISGGSYESPAMQGRTIDGDASSTLKREMYFIEFAKDIAGVATMPLMVTGGVTKLSTANMAMETGSVDVIGIARALAYQPDLPKQWQAQQNAEINWPAVTWKNQTFSALAVMSMTKAQLHRMAAGKRPKAKISPALALIKDRLRQKKQTKQYRNWLAGQA
ncbi:MAG: 2,4-dienoyl-CoA reductase [Robiginitomaculum sp.]|nr:MAG: 2,4-dienoyl-CoA reductase [Robiginitomaculum sp.]